MNMSDVHKSGFCDLLTGLLRRVMCGNRRGSSDSCYRELGDQDTLRFDRASAGSSDSQEPAKTLPEDAHEDTRVATPVFRTLNKKRRRRLILGVREEDAVIDDCYPMQVQLLLARCTKWEFDTHDLDRATGGQCLPILCMHLFNGYGLIDFFKLLPERCWTLFRSIEECYHASNPYHNSVHAADVTQAIHCFLQQKPIMEAMSRMEIMMVLLAAITHDLDHPGVNHAFLVATNHPLAIIFKDKDIGWNDRPPRLRRGTKEIMIQQMVHDLKVEKGEYSELESSPFKPKPIKKFKKKEEPHPQSILEHHHWRVAYSCVLQSGVFDHMPGQLPEIKSMLKSLILATDITRQNDYLDVFRKLLENDTLNMELSDHRHMVLQMALKTADISNPGRPWEISEKWSYSVCDEFYAQGDKEHALNLKVSNLCDRENDTVPKIQTGFFRYVVMPLYTEWHHYLNSDLSLKMLTNLIDNEAQWTTGNRKISQASKVSSENVISAENIVENELETSTNLSGSSEMLIPWQIDWSTFSLETQTLRRKSCSPKRQSFVKDVLRRYSAPLHLFCESRSRSRAKKSIPDCRLREDLQDVAVAAAAVEESRSRYLSMLEIAMVVAADRSRDQEAGPSDAVDPDAVSVSEQFIDLNSPRRALVGFAVQLDSDDEDSSKEKSSPNGKGGHKIGSVIIEESSISSASQLTSTAPSCSGVNGGSGLQFLLPTLSANTASAPSSESHLDRQLEEDIPAPKTVASSCELITFTPVKVNTVTDEIKDVLFPQLCIKDLYNRRRGSAPAPVAVSDLQRLASNLSLQLGFRKQTASSFHQLVAEEAPAVGSARRGSLPVEVMTGISAK